MRRIVAAALVVLLAVSGAPAGARAQTVFAAASLTDALKDIAGLWQQAGHAPLKMSFAASSALARQIDQGAPANLFASADEKWMDYLADRKLIAPDTRRDLLGNALVVVVPAESARTIDIRPGADFGSLLGPDGRLATGDPAHVPVGLYAEQALKKLGLWDSLAPRLARTEDVRAALLLVERGEAPAAIVYATDAAASKKVKIAGIFPADTHDPIRYPFAIVGKGDTAEARALLDFLSTAAARTVFQSRGFQVLTP